MPFPNPGKKGELVGLPKPGDPPRTHALNGKPFISVDKAGRPRTFNMRKPGDRKGVPVNWKPKHQLVLYMDIAGQPIKHIAQQLKYNADYVSNLMQSPLYQAHKRQLLAELAGVTLTDFIENIRQDATTNYRAMVELRDDPNRNLGDPKVQVAAARAIQHDQDRIWPRRVERTEEKTVKIILDSSALAKVAAGLAEARNLDPIDADFEEVAHEEPKLLNPVGVDELVERLAREATQSQSDS